MRKHLQMRRLAALGMAVALAVPCMAGCQKKGSDELILGLAVPETGASAYGGGVVKNAVTMAVNEINEAGGIDGKWKIKLVVEDNENEPAKSVTVMEKLVNQDNCHVVISSTASSCVLADMAVTQKAGVAELAPASTAAALTQQGNKYLFRTAATDAINVETLYKYLTETMGKHDIAVLYESNDFGMGAYTLLQDHAAEYGVNIKMAEAYNVGDVDFSVHLTKIKDANPDAIFVWGHYEEVTLMRKQMKQYNIDIPVMGTGYNSPKLIEMGGSDVEGVMFSACFTDANPDERVQEFNKKYLELYNEGYDQNAPQAYDTVYLITEAVKRAGKLDREAIRNEIAATKDFDGISGVMSFDENGEIIKDILMVEIRDGKHNLLTE